MGTVSQGGKEGGCRRGRERGRQTTEEREAWVGVSKWRLGWRWVALGGSGRCEGGGRAAASRRRALRRDDGSRGQRAQKTGSCKRVVGQRGRTEAVLWLARGLRAADCGLGLVRPTCSCSRALIAASLSSSSAFCWIEVWGSAARARVHAYVCVCVRMCVRMCVRTYVCAYVCVSEDITEPGSTRGKMKGSAVATRRGERG